MTKIKKTLDIGGGYRLIVSIDDGIAMMTSNYAKALIKVYFQTKKDHPEKNISYDYRRNVMIERFDISKEEYSKNLDADVLRSKKAQKETMEELTKKIENDKNNS